MKRAELGEGMSHYHIEDFPAEAIADCTGPGPADDAVAFWVDECRFHPDPEATRECLREYGAWDEEELADNEANRRRIFWLMMGDFAEWDGTPESPCGSDSFYIG